MNTINAKAASRMSGFDLDAEDALTASLTKAKALVATLEDLAPCTTGV